MWPNIGGSQSLRAIITDLNTNFNCHGRILESASEAYLIFKSLGAIAVT